ncbi:MAG: hypothetical protein WAV73_05030 [Candidatus Moraniibacteriota bacterium]
MNKWIRFFLAMVTVFILVTGDTVYCADKVNQSAKNNKWIKSIHKSISAVESQQAAEIISAVEKKLVIGKFNPRLKKIEASEKKKVSNPIFLVLLTEEDKKEPFWKGLALFSATQFIPALQAIVIDEGVEFSQEAMAISLAREYWLAYCTINGSYNSDTEWNAYAFLTKCMMFLGGESYVSLVYDEAGKLSKEIEESVSGWRSHFLAEPKEYDERLSFALWEPASDEEVLFLQRCFWIHTIFIMIENNPGLGHIAEQKAEFIRSIGHKGNVQKADKFLDGSYYQLYLR